MAIRRISSLPARSGGRPRRLLLLPVLLLAMVLWVGSAAPPALAQSEDAELVPASQAGGEGAAKDAPDALPEPVPEEEVALEEDFGGLEEITVTAQKREAGLQETPISITALNERFIEQAGISTAYDMTQYAPNMNVQLGANGNNFIVVSRGVAMGDVGNLSRDPSTAIYIDGIYMGMTIANLIDVTDLERVEMLRGPQGDLYGRNANGGAINFISRRPVTSEWGGRANLRVGNQDRVDFRGAVQFPILGGEGIGVEDRVGLLNGLVSFATINQLTPWINNVAGPDFEDQQRLVTNVALHYENGPFTADYAFYFNYSDEQGPEMQLTKFYTTGVTSPLLDGTLQTLSGGLCCVNQAAFENATYSRILALNGLRTNDTIDMRTHALTLNWNFDDLGWAGAADLKSITGYRSNLSTTSQDRDGSPYSIFENIQDTAQTQWTTELNLIGSMDHRWGLLDYTLGFFYFHEAANQADISYQLADDAFATVPNINPFPPPPIILVDIRRIQQTNPEIDNDAYAVYGHFAYTPPILDDRLTGEFGIRYTYEQRRIQSANEFLLYGGVVGFPPVEPETLPPSVGLRDFDAVTPRFTLRGRAFDEVNVYFTASRGFTAGGFNSRAANPLELAAFYKPEFVWNYEAGVKSQFWDDRLRLNVSGFYMDYSDMQRTILVVDSSGQVGSRVVNAAQSHISGIEIEMMAMPVDGLLVDFNYGWTLPEFDQFIIPDPVTGVLTDFAGVYGFALTPEHNLNIGVQYAFETDWFVVIPRVDYYWQTGFCLQNCDNPDTFQPPYGLLSARLMIDEIQLPGNTGQLAVNLWAKNLTNEQYTTFGIDFASSTGGSFPWVVQQWAEPTTVGVDFVWRFGTYE